MRGLLVTGVIGLLGLGVFAFPAKAHCDTLSGPVVTDAKAALQQNNEFPVLKWVSPNDEGLVRDAFKKTLAVRRLNPEAKELADTYFFETVVRLHRASEGAPYTGLKPAGTEEPIVRFADKALKTGSVESLADKVTEKVRNGLHQRFSQVIEAKKQADKNPTAGREYVRAYVTFLHYAENIHLAVMGNASDDHGKPASGHEK